MLNHYNTYFYASISNLHSPQTITGCFPKIKQLMDDNMVVIIGVALGIAALEV